MTLSKVLQPLVCCFGDAVAGNPTQFVMSRTAAETGMDWRFFTAYVQREDFEAAIRGIRALGLQGFCVLDPYQAEVVPFMDTVTESALALGRVTVGRVEGRSWLGDNLQGQSIWLTIQKATNQIAGEVKVDDDKQQARSKLLCVSSPALAKSIAVSERDWDAELHHIEPSLETEVPDFQENDAAQKPIALIVEGRIPRGLVKKLATVNWADDACFLQVSPRTERESIEDLEIARQLGLVPIDRLELVAQEAACNFQFWTGSSANHNLIRESIEEHQSC
ncbi:hypothetical protein SH449x_000822 [Pirellulaceae bacterium SH449]